MSTPWGYPDSNGDSFADTGHNLTQNRIDRMRERRDGDLRMLGNCDGFAAALVHIRAQIMAPLDGPYSPRIDPRHTRKLAHKAETLKPLRAMEEWLRMCHDETMAAYQQTRLSGSTRDR